MSETDMPDGAPPPAEQRQEEAAGVIVPREGGYEARFPVDGELQQVGIYTEQDQAERVIDVLRLKLAMESGVTELGAVTTHNPLEASAGTHHGGLGIRLPLPPPRGGTARCRRRASEQTARR